MSYNPRMSIAPRGAATPGRTTARTKREEEQSFMTLPDTEIANCITDIGIMRFGVEDLRKPNAGQIQRIFEWFAELLMGTTRENVAPAMRAGADDVYGPYSEVFSADTRDVLGFFAVLRRIMVESGIHDFGLADLYRPTYPRLVRLFSHVINFIRFREFYTDEIDRHYNKSEDTKARIEALYHENKAKEDELASLEANRDAAEAAIHAKQARFDELHRVLRGLKDDQDRVVERLERHKAEQTRLKALLEERTAAHLTARQDAEKLRPYTEQSPQALESSLHELSDSLARDRGLTEQLDRRARALTTSADSFGTAASDVRGLTSLLTDVQRDLAAEEAATLAAQRNRDALAERSNNVRDVEREEKMLQKQLENVQRRTEKLRRNAEERRETENKKMEDLKKVNEEIRQERGERGREMERRRVRIEQTEKKMADLKENIENEIHAAHAEYVKMDSHIRLYIKEMETSIIA